MRYYNATEYIKKKNKERKEQGRSVFNLPQFVRINSRVQEVCKELEKNNTKPHKITQGLYGKIIVAEPIMNLIVFSEDFKKLLDADLSKEIGLFEDVIK